MVEANGSTPVYVGGNDGFNFGGGGFMAFLIFALLMGGGNWMGNNRNAIGYENLATSNEVQRGFDNQNSMANQREILAAVSDGTAQSVAATNRTFQDAMMILNDKYSELQRDVANNALTLANVEASQQKCCCDTLRAIDGVNYNNALNTASINANATAQAQKILDAITGNRMADMQNQINQLELKQALCGVVRYPNAMMYNAGQSPFCGCGSYNGCGSCNCA